MYCVRCGTEFEAEEQRCARCGHARPDAGDATGGIIPYKNPPALIAYYLGLFSVLPFLGFPMGIAATVLGIAGLKRRRANPAVRGAVHAWIGIGCGLPLAVGWVVAAYLLFLD